MPAPSEIFATFSGGIDSGGVQRFLTGITQASGNGVKSLHLFFHSSGGTISDGICLYNYFRSVPIEMSIYNAGSVASAAVIAFLGAKNRHASAHATFMIHRPYTGQVQAGTDRLQGLAESLAADDARVEHILRSHLSLPQSKWDLYKTSDVTVTAKEAVDFGFIQSVKEFQPPSGGPIFNV